VACRVLTALVGLHAVLGLGVLAVARPLGRRAFLVAGLAPFAVAVWAATQAGRVLDGQVVTATTAWAPRLGLTLDLRLDGFALLMVVLVAGVGTLVFAYGWHYFAGSQRAGKAAGLLVLFAGSMLGVVLADNVLVLYLCWELTSVTSFLLIGLDDRDAGARGAALHALLVTGAGGLAMLGGLIVIANEARTYRLSAILEAPPSGTAVSVALVFVLLGAFTKSAQYPFHSWLPGAMVAPTPISAYLHSAAMVKAGVYLVARFAPAFAPMGIWRPLVVAVGLTTMIAGGLRALRPWDLKQLLAFGTISQLGFLMVLFGLGQPEATVAGCALLLAHALFKAALFMVVGIVDHGLHTRDIRALPELGPAWSPTRLVAAVSAASMAAVPPLAGFIAKETAYGALVHGTGADRAVLAGIVIGSVLTVAYSLRFAVALVRPALVQPLAPALGADPPVRAADGTDHPPSAAFLAPAGLLALLTVGLGLVPGPWSELVDTAAHTLDHRAHAHLVLWHGVNAALVLSVLTLGLGTALFAARHRMAVLQQRFSPTFTGTDGYDAVVRAVLRAAARTTAVVQSGSLPVYAAVILTTAVVAPSAALVAGDWWPGWPPLLGSPAHVAVSGLLIGGAVSATVTRRRFGAALLLGVVGYGMALLFVVQGAPDLALTQFAAETLSVLVFLLVLRSLPDRFEQPTPAVRVVPRLVVSVLVGLFMAGMALVAAGSRTAAPVSGDMSARAYPEGYGRNVVNVILVDIRGMDTLGEITVLVAAAIGVVSLVRVGRRPRPPVRWTAGHPDGIPRSERRRRGGAS
jgi:multicomponent Na+:H+ antiporter subunit A